MDFLDYLDTEYNRIKSGYSANEVDDSFSVYFSVSANGLDTSSDFLIKKQDKSKLFIVSGMQRVYLRDSDIIRIVIGLSSKEANWFLKALIDAYGGEYTEFNFKINDQSFTGKGIVQYPDKRSLTLVSDTEITIQDFVFVVNFVLAKDYLWEEKVGIVDFRKRTLSKYISLIDWFVNHNDRSKRFLETIGYPIPDKSERIFENQSIKELFFHTEMFDISNYL
ncbi:hypothetical protein [uncultured Ruminococcus sp.]|uniref:hypothetical protein n=1 Tax=uncultured Ruminococcus sp. TaxID=165186 RepID=UPI00292EAE17|nr:hypothetical protein [uncultured Ruminococcus sp.]